MPRFINNSEVPVETRSDVSKSKRHQGNTHFSLIGTTMYFFENISTLDVHFFTLWYPSSRLKGDRVISACSIRNWGGLPFLVVELLVEERTKDMNLIREIFVLLSELC
jgi:hypothetical protein